MSIKRSFKTRIFVTVFIVALLPLIICVGVMTPLLVRGSVGNLQRQAQARLEQLTGALLKADETLASASDALMLLPYSSDDDRALYQALFSLTSEAQAFSRFSVYDETGVCRYAVGGAGDGALPVDWGALRAARMEDGLVYRLTDDGRLLAARAVRDDAGEATMYLVFSLDDASFDSLFLGLYDTADNVLVLDSRWRLVYHSQNARGEAVAALLRQELLDSEPLTGGSDEFRFYAAQAGAFTVVLQQPNPFTGGVMSAFYLVTGLTSALCLLFCLWGAWMLSRHLSQPVKELSVAMGQVERGEFGVRIQTDREDELGRLSGSFNHMVAEYQDYLDRSVQRQRELNDAQLRMMQAQLNPHFLYNTLDSVKWLAVEAGQQPIASLATDLADLLRAAISADEFITLETELELVERYVDIQLVRFGDRFTCEIDVGEQFRRCLVPKLVLQPIVENAIIHGVAQREDGYVKLSAIRQGADMLVTVSDNGIGMPKELLKQLNEGELCQTGGHLGLHNVGSILRLHYGAQYGITASAEAGAGSRVCLRLPMQQKEA